MSTVDELAQVQRDCWAVQNHSSVDQKTKQHCRLLSKKIDEIQSGYRVPEDVSRGEIELVANFLEKVTTEHGIAPVVEQPIDDSDDDEDKETRRQLATSAKLDTPPISLSDIDSYLLSPQELSLCNMGITDNDVTVLVEYLISHPNIESLCLDGNQICDAGFQKLALALVLAQLTGKFSRALTLSLKNNPLSDVSQTVTQGLLQVNPLYRIILN